jgi:hypothetical protein
MERKEIGNGGWQARHLYQSSGMAFVAAMASALAAVAALSGWRRNQLGGGAATAKKCGVAAAA